MEQNGTRGTNLSPKQLQALDLILQGKPLSDVAEAIGVGRTTLYRWTKSNVHFAQAVDAGKRRLSSEIEERMSSFAQPALTILEELVHDKTLSGPTRLRLALAILNRLPSAPEEAGFLEDAKLFDRLQAAAAAQAA